MSAKSVAFLVATAIALLARGTSHAQDPKTAPTPPTQQTALDKVSAIEKEILQVNMSIWDYAEVGLQEVKSSALLVNKLRKHGFTVETGVSDMPTAFVATYGSGKPVIGILAEYDALPGLSQKVVDFRSPVNAQRAGHACGHSGLGAGAFGAAIAVKEAIAKHELKGTIRLYGTPAEETGIGKVYMLLDGQFRDLDICLHWHPSTYNQVWAGSSKALLSVKFTFTGTAAHASVSPENGRSALDAVELMNVGVNYMREHVKEDARLHYVISDGGGAPNVVPATATVWYYIRADNHADVERNFQWVADIARGAALMTRTQLKVQIDTDCHEIVPNAPLAELLQKNLTAVGPPAFSKQEQAFARRLQQSLSAQFGTRFPLAINQSVQPLSMVAGRSKGSTDVGDISWHVPTGGFRATCHAAGSPGHSWQNVATIGSSIGEKGIVYAAKVMAVSAVELFENPKLVQSAREDWKRRMTGIKYKSLIPEGQKAPVKIR